MQRRSPEVSEFLDRHPEWLSHADLLTDPPALCDIAGFYPESAGSEIFTIGMTSYGVPAYLLYVRLRREGNGHRFAEMIACQQGPGLKTDVAFFQGQPALAEQFGSAKQLKRYIDVARKNGYNPGSRDVYQPGLARFPGDPEAFVPPTGGRGYVKRLCEKRGWACEGSVNVPYREPLEDPQKQDKPLAEDLIRHRMKVEMKKNPMLAKNQKQLREKIVEKHGPSK